MRLGARILALFLLAVLGAAGQYAQAATYNVNCSKNEHIGKALRVLASASPQGPNTINVTGVCHGNFVIQSMDRLTLITKNGASLTDPSSGSLVVVDIEDSRGVTVQGFTINGGSTGVNCGSASVCYLTGNTIQGGGVGVGGGSHAFLESNVIENGVFRGSTVGSGSQMFSSNDVFQDNAAQGVAVTFGAYFESSNSSFLNNGVGVEAALNSSVRLRGGTISGSVNNGVTLLAGTAAVFQGVTVTGNGGTAGVHLEDGSFAGFFGTTVTGNLSGMDVECKPKFPATRFVATTGGITNCVEPASDSKLRAVQ